MSLTGNETLSGGSFLIEKVSCERVYTPEDFTDEQKLVAQTIDDFIENEVMPHMEKLENQDFALTVQLMKKAGQLGLLAADIPEKYGGLGLDKITSAIITEKFARSGGFSITHGAHTGIGSLPIILFGTEAQRKKYLPYLATGEKLAAYALTEPDSGSDALSARTTAKLNEAGTHYVLNGEKQWITNSGFADIFIVYGKIDGEQFSAFIVERDYPGVSTGSEEKKMGLKSSSTRTLILEDALVPKENLLGEPGKGHIIAFNILNIGRYKLGIGAVGAAKRALDITIQYTNERRQFKRPISHFHLTKEKLASMAALLYAAESAVYRTVGLFEEKMSALTPQEAEDKEKVAESISEYAIECSLNKVFASEMLDSIADEGVQLHGGYGYMADYEIERIYRDSRINRIFEGTNEINRLLIPATFMRKAMKGQLPLLEKAAQLQNELVTYIPEAPGEGPLAKEIQLVDNGKKIALLIAGLAVKKYGKKLEQEQEILVNIADIISNVYAMESAVLRTEKAIKRTNADASRQKLLYTEIFCQSAFVKIEQDAKETLYAVEEGDSLLMMLAALRKFTRFVPGNIIAKKREAAEALIKVERFVL